MTVPIDFTSGWAAAALSIEVTTFSVRSIEVPIGMRRSTMMVSASDVGRNVKSTLPPATRPTDASSTAEQTVTVAYRYLMSLPSNDA